MLNVEFWSKRNENWELDIQYWRFETWSLKLTYTLVILQPEEFPPAPSGAAVWQKNEQFIEISPEGGDTLGKGFPIITAIAVVL